MKKLYYILFLINIVSCVNQFEKNQADKNDETSFIPIDEYLNKEINQEFVQNYIGKGEYHQLLNKFKDEISQRNISYTREQKNLNYFVDSIVCMNKSKDEVIFFECYTNIKSELDAQYIWRYGKKINEKWYVFPGAIQNIYKPNDHSNTEKDVHKWIKKATRGYLKRDSKGNLIINDSFFNHFVEIESDFKNVAITKNKMEKNRICVIYSMRDFYEDKMLHEVYKPKDFIFDYDKNKRELEITCPIKKWNEFPVGYEFYWDIGDKTFSRQDYEKGKFFIPMSETKVSKTIQNINPNDEFVFVIYFVANSTIDGVGTVYYKFKLQNGKAKFVGLVPDENSIKGYEKPLQDSLRKAWQKRIDERLGKNYGK